MENIGKLETIRSLIPYPYEITDAGGGSAVFFYVPYKPFKLEKDVARIDSFYIASNLAHKLAGEYAEKLREAGMPCVSNPDINYKAKIGGSVGKNTLLYRKGMGSRFAIGAILLEERLPKIQNAGYVDMPCPSCNLCEKACPLGAIGKRFDRSRCMRQYMTRPENAGEDVLAAFENRLLGCDICQRVCPANTREEQSMSDEIKEILFYPNFVQSLQSGDLGAFSDYFGKNYAKRNFLLAMFLIAAGNMGDDRFIDIAKEGLKSDSPRLRAASIYALKKLKRE